MYTLPKVGRQIHTLHVTPFAPIHRTFYIYTPFMLPPGGSTHPSTLYPTFSSTTVQPSLQNLHTDHSRNPSFCEFLYPLTAPRSQFQRPKRTRVELAQSDYSRFLRRAVIESLLPKSWIASMYHRQQMCLPYVVQLCPVPGRIPSCSSMYRGSYGRISARRLPVKR